MHHNSRIEYIDGLRGVAILAVMSYHAFARWPERVPYGAHFANFPVFSNGWLGVELFFIISGFVILLTLEKCHTFKDFLVRRWLRLFPAMLACSVLVYATLPLFPERPAGPHMPMYDLLPGLSLLGPSIWGKLLHSPVTSLEGAFWSLFVEVKFYIVFGALYFFVNRKAAIGALLACSVLVKLLADATVMALLPHQAAIVETLLTKIGALYFGWFAAGAIFYQYTRTQQKSVLALGVIVALWSALSLTGFTGWTIAAFVVVALFVASLLISRVQALLSNKALLFIGFVSYPLYLLHENMMIAMIIKIGHFFPRLPAILMPILPMAVVIGFGWGIATYVEPTIRTVIRSSSALLRRSLGNISSIPSENERNN